MPANPLSTYQYTASHRKAQFYFSVFVTFTNLNDAIHLLCLIFIFLLPLFVLIGLLSTIYAQGAEVHKLWLALKKKLH